jgi:hypothetical protein
MKHVCCDCGVIIEQMGYPVAKLVDFVTTAFFEGNFMVYHPILANASPEINPALKYLEEWGILVSTEISTQLIAIIPNLSLGYIDEFTAEICWCTLFDLNNDDDDDDNEEFDLCIF